MFLGSSLFLWAPWMKLFILSLYIWKVKVPVAYLCLALCESMDCSPPGSSVHGIFQARILEWVAIPFSKGSSQPRGWIRVSSNASRFFTVWAPGKPLIYVQWQHKRNNRRSAFIHLFNVQLTFSSIDNLSRILSLLQHSQILPVFFSLSYLIYHWS